MIPPSVVYQCVCVCVSYGLLSSKNGTLNAARLHFACARDMQQLFCISQRLCLIIVVVTALVGWFSQNKTFICFGVWFLISFIKIIFKRPIGVVDDDDRRRLLWIARVNVAALLSLEVALHSPTNEGLARGCSPAFFFVSAQPCSEAGRVWSWWLLPWW